MLHCRPKMFRRPEVIGAFVALTVFLSLALLAGGGCERVRHRPPRVLLVGIDGADWRFIRPHLSDDGLPNLRGLIRDGSHGPLGSVRPFVSPVLWNTIATGKGPDEHGITGWFLPESGDDAPRHATANARRSKAFWNILSEREVSVCVVGWWMTAPAEPVHGVMVSDALIDDPARCAAAEDACVWPPERAAEIARLCGTPDEVSYTTARDFLDVSEEHFAQASGEDPSDLVTRFRYAYQGMQNAATVARHLIRTDGPDVVAVGFKGIETIGHFFQPTARTVAAFYRYQDELLGELLELCDDTTTVIVFSDHGFVAGSARHEARRPGRPERWHRSKGILLAKGPQVASRTYADDPAAIVTQGTVFDLVPTLLALLGLPVPADMEGRVLTELFSEEMPMSAILESYEDDAWRTERAALGIKHPGMHPSPIWNYWTAGSTLKELALRSEVNLAQYYAARERDEEAERLLRDLCVREPDWFDAHYRLGRLYMRQQKYTSARLALERALAIDPDRLTARMNLAFVQRELGNRTQAIAILKEGAARHVQHAGVRVNLAMLYKELNQMQEALDFLAVARRLDPDHREAHRQTALVYELLGNLEKAVEYWGEVLRIDPDDESARGRIALHTKGIEIRSRSAEEGTREP